MAATDPDSRTQDWWRPLTSLGDRVFLAKMMTSQTGYRLLVTDLGQIWEAAMEESDIQSLCEILNPSMDAPVKTVVQHLNTAITDPNKVKAVFTLHDEDLVELKMTSQLAGFPFKWNMQLDPAGPDKLREEMTLPFMMMISELSRQNKDLIKLVGRKDSELENYKMQGYKVTRKNLVTERFDETTFRAQNIVSEGFQKEVASLGHGAVTETNQRLYDDVVAARRRLGKEQSTNLAEAWGMTASVKESPSVSPVKSPAKSAKPETKPKEPEETEVDRKRALEEKLAKQEHKLEESKRKKRKLKL